MIYFPTYILLILGIIGLIVIIILKRPEKKVKSSVTFSKFSFLIMNYLYIDEKFHDKLLEDANKLDKDKLYRFMVREIHKTKDSEEINKKILNLFQEFHLIEFTKSTFLKSNSERKIRMMEDFGDLTFVEISDLLHPIIFENHPPIMKINAIRAITKKGINSKFLEMLVIMSSFPESLDVEISETIYNISHTNPNEIILDPSMVSLENQPILSNRFISLLFKTEYKHCIAGAYIIGYLRVKSAAKFLIERLEQCEEKEAMIVILKALYKIADMETASGIYEFILSKKKIDTDVLHESLKVLNNLGIIGSRFLTKLTESDNPMIKIIAKSYNSSTQ